MYLDYCIIFLLFPFFIICYFCFVFYFLYFRYFFLGTALDVFSWAKSIINNLSTSEVGVVRFAYSLYSPQTQNLVGLHLIFCRTIGKYVFELHKNVQHV